jgi:hypothetical protein
MKTAKLFFQYASFYWDCMNCGMFNTVSFTAGKKGYITGSNKEYRGSITNKKVILFCSCCGKKRKAKIEFTDVYNPSEKRKKKLKKLQKAFMESHGGKWKKKGNRYYPPKKKGKK